MRVWTIQPVEIYDLLLKNKVLYTDITKSSLYSDAGFIKGYNWLSKRMEEKIGRPVGAEFPWWAWYKRGMRHSKPDLRESGYSTRGDRLVCLELEVDDTQVVLTDFDDWWFCISDVWNSHAKSDKEFDELENWYKGLDSDTQESLKIKSWESVFDTELNIKAWQERGKWVQATFWELRLCDVRDIRYFIAK